MPFRSHRFIQSMLHNTQQRMVDIYNKDKTYSTLKQYKISPKLLKPSNAAVEWWYWTGHLNNRFGFEFCMFKLNPLKQRLGIVPMSSVHHNEWYSLHAAITDVKQKTFIAKSSASYFHEPKPLQSPNGKITGLKKLECNFNNLKMDLLVEPLTKLLPHSETGYNTIGGIHNLYLSYPRCDVTGTITLNNEIFNVTGDAWFDHQKMAESHLPNIKGWDWFCAHIGDTNIMVYQLREHAHNFVAGTIQNKHTEFVKDVIFKPTKYWVSPSTKARYPIEWDITINNILYKVKSNVQNQEMNLLHSPMAYYEGSVSWYKGKKKVGHGYMELVGYDKRLRTKLVETITR